MSLVWLIIDADFNVCHR